MAWICTVTAILMRIHIISFLKRKHFENVSTVHDIKFTVDQKTSAIIRHYDHLENMLR